MSVITIGGTQSSGKSTLINALKDKSHNVDIHSSARHILKEMDITLEDLKNDIDLIIEFQDKLFIHKYNRDMLLNYNTEEYVFVERSLIDLLVYANALHIDLMKDEKFKKWYFEYKDNIFDAQKLYEHNIVIPSGIFDHVDDGIRADKTTQLLVEIGIGNIFMDSYYHHTVLTSSSVNDRVLEVENILSKIGF